MSLPVVAVINAVIELNRFVSVIQAGLGLKHIVSRRLRGRFHVGYIGNAFGNQDPIRSLKGLRGQVIKIVLRIEGGSWLIGLPQILNTRRFGIGPVLTGQMVGNKINDKLQPIGMRALDKCVEFGHSPLDVYGQIGIDIIIVFNGVRRPCASVHHQRIILFNTVV